MNLINKYKSRSDERGYFYFTKQLAKWGDTIGHRSNDS